MRIPLWEFIARKEDGSLAQLEAYAKAHSNGLEIDLDDLGPMNDRTPPSARNDQPDEDDE